MESRWGSPLWPARCCFSASSTTSCLRDAPSGIALGDTAGIRLLDSYAVEVLHVALPIYFILDLLLAPRRRGLPWWSLAVIVGYPLGWTAYTMVRGLRVSNPDGSTSWWYPYPFLDPHNAGYGSAFTYIGVMLVGFLAIGAIIIAIGRYREKRAAVRGGAAPPPAPCTPEHVRDAGSVRPTRHLRVREPTGRAAPPQ